MSNEALDVIGVDLRALQYPRIVDIAHLGLRVEVEDLPPTFAMPVAGLLHPTKRQMRFGTDRRRVHIGDAVLQVFHRTEGKVEITGVDGAGESVLYFVI